MGKRSLAALIVFCVSGLVVGCGSKDSSPRTADDEYGDKKKTYGDDDDDDYAIPPYKDPGSGQPTAEPPTDIGDTPAELKLTAMPWLPPTTCLSTVVEPEGGRIISIDINTGIVTKGALLPGLSVLGPSSFGIRGDELYTCGQNGNGESQTVSITNPVTGVVKHTKVDCAAVTADDKGIWVQEFPGVDSGLSLYANAAALEARTPAGSKLKVQSVESIGRGDDAVWTAWHSTNKLQRVDRQTGVVTELPLERFDDWVQGVSAAAKTVFVVSPTWSKEDGRALLIAFDATTGKQLGVSTMSFDLHGLSCTTTPAPVVTK
jgi:hypothetical protein